MEALGDLDAAFLRIETPETALTIGSLAVLDGPPPSPAELGEVIAAKLPALPRYRQVVRELPLRIGRPIWVDDQSFDLSYHLRRTALPRPGSEHDLDVLVGRLMSQRLRRDRPLWEMWVVEGLADGRWAIVSKVHHCMVDGIAGAGLMDAVFDRSADAIRPSPVGWQPRAAPGFARLVAAAAVPAVAPGAVVASVRDAIRRPKRTARGMALRLHGLLDFGLLAHPTAKSSLTGTLAPTRTWARCTIPLADVRTVRHALGGTVNDVVVAAVTRGLRDLLEAQGEPPVHGSVRALVPVSVRVATEHDRPNNQVSAVVAELPVDEPTTLSRLAAVRRQLDRLKRSGEAQAGELVVDAAALVPGPVLAYGLSGLFRIPQRFVTTVVTNVPGPREPLYFAGRRMRSLYPYVPIADRLRVGVAIMSYCDTLYVGISADRDHVHDLDAVVCGIRAEMETLLALATPGSA
ncbi:MAG TPA: wax ester/triacylglycerol synthase family O-acyltransferase [Jatrophihabitantaceae bacterium]|nr:wax ester/triacylglycerol synthase family O-acyltransferase [Jatrophihabitantaceae bacterium]